MTHRILLTLNLLLIVSVARADVILDWNTTMCDVMQEDGILNINKLANPGWSTRSLAMVNNAMYDAFQSVNRTHQPYLFNELHANASQEAAAAVAAHSILLDCYPLRQTLLDARLATTLSGISNGAAKTAGIALGESIATQYMASRLDDHSNTFLQWPEGTLPGEWRSDPLHNPQEAWGPAWGTVQPFGLSSSTQFNVPGPPGLGSAEYAAAYDQVMNYGANATYGPSDTPTSRTADQTEIGLFWAYDRQTMGPPPVLFSQAVKEIAKEVGTSPEENARLFALVSTAMADASIAAWDIKFDANFWRPITAIREGGNDGNAMTMEDVDWVPLGAPGATHNDPNNPLAEDDFTPPFPAYTSGHATMGGATFKALELFFGTNDFSTADAKFGSDPITSIYALTSAEEGGGGTRWYDSFTQQGLIDVGLENSPEGENATSRLYLGVHWIFDQRDGNYLGNDIANYIFETQFVAIPEPTSVTLAGASLVAVLLYGRRTRRNRITHAHCA